MAHMHTHTHTRSNYMNHQPQLDYMVSCEEVNASVWIVRAYGRAGWVWRTHTRTLCVGLVYASLEYLIFFSLFIQESITQWWIMFSHRLDFLLHISCVWVRERSSCVCVCFPSASLYSYGPSSPGSLHIIKDKNSVSSYFGFRSKLISVYTCVLIYMPNTCALRNLKFVYQKQMEREGRKGMSRWSHVQPRAFNPADFFCSHSFRDALHFYHTPASFLFCFEHDSSAFFTFCVTSFRNSNIFIL